MTYILMIYTIVALGPNPTQASDWRALSEFNSAESCESGAKHLGINANRYRCVKK